MPKLSIVIHPLTSAREAGSRIKSDSYKKMLHNLLRCCGLRANHRVTAQLLEFSADRPLHPVKIKSMMLTYISVCQL